MKVNLPKGFEPVAESLTFITDTVEERMDALETMFKRSLLPEFGLSDTTTRALANERNALGLSAKTGDDSGLRKSMETGSDPDGGYFRSTGDKPHDN
jgi:hypothetical protein